MSEWEAEIDFGTYQGKASFWAKSDGDARKYCKKHYPKGIILSLKNLSEKK